MSGSMSWSGSRDGPPSSGGGDVTAATHYLWLDLETTGLELSRDRIMEVAAIFTGTDLVELGRNHIVLPLDDIGWERLRGNPFVLGMHAKSGLLAECAERKDVDGHALHTADRYLADLIGRLVPAGVEANIRLAGSGVSHFDLAFVRRWMPRTMEHLDWRPFDVGQMEEWFLHCGLPTYDDVHPGEKARKTHRAMDDIEYHLDEARWYVGRLRDSAR